MDELLDLITVARRKQGLPVEPHPREVWAVDRHEKVPKAELRQQQQETQELLAAARARNDQIEAELQGEQAPINHQEES